MNGQPAARSPGSSGDPAPSESAARDPFARYLRLLGVPARPPGMAALAELVEAHLTRVPFENVSKLLHRGDAAMRLPPLSRFLDGIERHHLGGTCYANNSSLNALLVHLGYDARLCGADMSKPDVHLVNIVRLDDREFLVDGGYGAPFLAPMPLDPPQEHAIEQGGDRYVLRPRGPDGRSRMEQYRDGRLRHGYTVNPAPRRIGEFAGVIADSFAPTATFMNVVMVARFFPGRSVVVRNLSLIESEGAARRVLPIEGREGLARVIEERLGIPRELVARAIEGIELRPDALD